MTGQTLVIVGCGAAKRPRELVPGTLRVKRYPAKAVYTSGFSTVKSRFAEAVGDDWMILSAEHGLLAPDEEIAPYDTTIDDLARDELADLADAVCDDLRTWIDWGVAEGQTVERVVVLLGRRYRDPLEARGAFEVEPHVEHPLQNPEFGGIGDQMNWMNQQIDAHQQSETNIAGGRCRC